MRGEFVRYFVFLILSAFSLFSYADLPTYLVAVRAGYFLFSDNTLRSIYDNGGAALEVELNGKIFEMREHNLFGFASTGYFSKQGHSIGLGDSTCIREIPLSIGLKYAHQRPIFYHWPYIFWFAPYAGLGYEYVHIRIHNHSDFVKQHVRDHSSGGVVKLGTLFYCSQALFFDLFANYSFAYRNFHGSELEGMPDAVERFGIRTRGWTFGAGVGYGF